MPPILGPNSTQLTFLFTQYWSCDDTPERIFFQIWTFSCLHAAFLMNTKRFKPTGYRHMICTAKTKMTSEKVIFLNYCSGPIVEFDHQILLLFSHKAIIKNQNIQIHLNYFLQTSNLYILFANFCMIELFCSECLKNAVRQKSDAETLTSQFLAM